MKIEEVLENLEELLRGWGLSFNDWILTGEYSWRLQNFKVQPRKGHLDVFLNKEKLPWKVRSEDKSTTPFPKSLEFNQLKEFAKKTKFDPHFLVSVGLKPYTIEDLRRQSRIYILPNKRKIRILRILDELKGRAEILLKVGIKNWDKSTLKRLLSYFRRIRKIAEKKNDKKMIKICNSLFKNLKQF